MDANAVKLSMGSETSQGVQADPLNMMYLMYNGGGFEPSTEFTDIEEVNPNLTATGTVPTSISLEGTPEFNYSYAEQFQRLLPASIYSTGDETSWGGGTYEFNTTGAEINAVVVTGPPIKYQFTAAAADAVFAKVTTGQWIKISGFSEEGNNGFFYVTEKITTGDPHKITVSSVLVAETGTAIDIQGSMIRNGRDASWNLNNKQTFFCFEQGYPMLEDQELYFLIKGCQVSSLELTLAPNALVTGSVGFMGTTYSYQNTPFGAAYSSNTVYPKMSAADSRTVVQKDGQFHKVTNFGITFSDLARARNVVGNICVDSTGRNSLKPELAISQYWSSTAAFLSSYDIKTGKSVERMYSAKMGDTDGNTFIFTFPKVVLTGVALPGGALDEDLVIEGTGKVFPYTDPVSLQTYAVQIDRFAAA